MVFRFSRAFYQNRPRGLVSMGIDPGTRNTGCVVTRQNGKQVTVLHADMIDPVFLIRDFDEKTAPAKVAACLSHFASLLDRFKPDHVVVELFMLRGFRTNDGSYISFMLGGLAEMCRQRAIPFSAFLPPNWKRKICNLGEKGIKAQCYPHYPVPHLVDSFLLSLFAQPTLVPTFTLAQVQSWIRQLPLPKTVVTKPKAKSTKRKKPAKAKTPKSASKKQPAKRSQSARSLMLSF